jgi:hypothetical protein
LNDDTLGALIRGRLNQRTGGAAINRDDFDARQRIRYKGDVLAPYRVAVKDHPVIVRVADEAEVAGVEGFDPGCVHLGTFDRFSTSTVACFDIKAGDVTGVVMGSHG